MNNNGAASMSQAFSAKYFSFVIGVVMFGSLLLFKRTKYFISHENKKKFLYDFFPFD